MTLRYHGRSLDARTTSIRHYGLMRFYDGWILWLGPFRVTCFHTMEGWE